MIQTLFANILWMLYSAFRSRKWKKGRKHVQQTQCSVLGKIISSNANTIFGREHQFKNISSVQEFQRKVPIRSYEDFHVYIDRIAEGEKDVLTADPTTRFGITSGSTKASKLVPYNSSLVAEFQKGIDPWMYFLMIQNPGVLTGKTYWSVTPVGQKEKYSLGGIPIGFDDERSYFGKFTSWILRSTMAVPEELALIKDMDTFRYVTLRFLLQEKSLSWISVWNPSFAILLLNSLESYFELLVEDIRTGKLSVNLNVDPKIDQLIRNRLKKSQRRAAQLLLTRNNIGKIEFHKVWPNLKVISCWTQGNSKEGSRKLEECFPNSIIQPKGLLATEGFVSFPFVGEQSALSIDSHFFEFEDVDTGDIKLAYELEVERKYSVIMTTGGGLYRYRLNDVIQVLGYSRECPLICFVGRQDKVVDVCGEKMNEVFVEECVNSELDSLNCKSTFWMMAPQAQRKGIGYVLFLQIQSNRLPEDLEGKIESKLRENYHYNYCRMLGQLQQFRIYLILPDEGTFEIYQKVCVRLGQRLGDIKSVSLHSYQSWASEFNGTYV